MTTLAPERASVFLIPAAMPVNRLLRSASWARDKLRPFAGKTVRFHCAPLGAALTISGDGLVSDATADAAVDAEFTLTPGLVARALAADETAWREIRISGDNTLASAAAYVAQHLRWDVEEDLSRAFGDVVAHRVMRVGTEILRTQKQLIEDFARAGADYLTQQRPLFANRAEVANFKREVDALHDVTERLARRVETLLQNDR